MVGSRGSSKALAGLWGHRKAVRFDAQMYWRVSDHVHLLLSTSKNFSTAELARRLKAGSSYWIHETFPELKEFGWQAGYGAFSVGVSQLADTVAYISGQEEHHRTKSFREKYVGFLRKHGYPDHLLTASFTPTLRGGADLKS